MCFIYILMWMDTFWTKSKKGQGPKETQVSFFSFMKGEDTMRTYVISVKRTKNYIGNHLAEENQYWEYAQYDDHAGSFSTGYPGFGGERVVL